MAVQNVIMILFEIHLCCLTATCVYVCCTQEAYKLYRVCTVSVSRLVAECEMADFVTGSSSEKIPFVFLPLAGQLVYPR